MGRRSGIDNRKKGTPSLSGRPLLLIIIQKAAALTALFVTWEGVDMYAVNGAENALFNIRVGFFKLADKLLGFLAL